MVKLFPGILVATLAAIPGWVIGAYFSSPKLLSRPLSDQFAMFIRGTLHFYLFYTVLTLVYGSIIWWVLRALGLLNLPWLLLAAFLPVAVYIAHSISRYGYDSGWTGAAWAFGIPALLIGAALWLFTVRIPL
jgi:hypothetical protein